MQPTPRLLIDRLHRSAARALAPVLLLAAAVLAGGCATGRAVQPLVAEQPVRFEGRVVSVDLSPWTYDGNGVVVVDTAAHGTVKVQFPARWNLCQAPAPQGLDALKPGDRVSVVATASAADEAVVCADARHGLTPLG
ncbi:hypothetical protein [Cognatilysobacter tabacisoli]|uniref:hypothetical protein n=1 Tax=Cognatilysobacter tabacisoli TaxID=2315424 RepID=UPI000E6AEB38|nr:hypothetical protein [Lysobacter tabacisoli]